MFITDPLGIAWRVDLSTEEEAEKRFNANRVFDIAPDQWQRVISLCTKDGRATGETALLIKGVTTMTTCQVEHAKIFPEDFKCMERGSCDLPMGGSWNDWFQEGGRTVQMSEMVKGSDPALAVTPGGWGCAIQSGDIWTMDDAT